MESNEEILKNVKQRICKRDNSLKLQFKVQHFFFGGYELKLLPNSPLSIQVNSNGKTSMRFMMEADDTFGLRQKDIGCSLTQFESLLLTTDEEQLPPMLACYMLPGCIEKMCIAQPGLRSVLKEQLKFNNTTKIFNVMIFVLKPWNRVEYYMKAVFMDQGKEVERPIDIDDAEKLLKEEVRAVWDQMKKERKAKAFNEQKAVREPRHEHHVMSFTETVNAVNHEQFNRILSELKISRKPNKQDGTIAFVDAKKGGVQNFSNGGNRILEPFTASYAGKKDVSGAKRPRLDLDPRYQVLQSQNCQNWPNDYQSLNNQCISHLEGTSVDDLTNKMTCLGHTNYVENHSYYQNLNAEQYCQVDSVTNGFNGNNIAQAPASSIATVSPQGDAAKIQLNLALNDRKRAGPGIENKALSEPRPTGDEPLVTLPPSPFGGETISLIIRDIRTLDRKEFVNDNVMAFMMNYISSYRIKKELILKIHMFNTFFYQSLAKGITPLGFSGRVGKNANDPETLKTNILRMQRWTRKFDLFAKDYIVIPINEDFHWMVVAVINPQGALIEDGNEEASRNAPKCFMVFYDPLSGLDPTRRMHITHMIKEYLAAVCGATKGANMKYAVNKGATFDKNQVVVVRPKNAPIQNNFSDCGLYALHFIEGLFCNIDRPVTVDDFPEFDWKECWPEADKMCEFTRDKIYNLIKKRAGPRVRSRIEQYEHDNRCGLSREGESRKSRRHSAVPCSAQYRTPRNTNYYRRFYSLNPPPIKVVQEEPFFSNPRNVATMPVTQKVRKIRPPELSFPLAY
ncbi:CBN-ULP-2 protein [Caenorhabditis brenneri]|uniref:CBN-ULP-2 protein n=1 Tax=Caenorhabditis brenneri TaxID=135651 RepID=G0MPW7_CAEBE|nr:CBN-ULP-2 protein [Caenorhabditis brenneri]